MAISKIKDGGVKISSQGVTIPGASSFIFENEEDIEKLPTGEKQAAIGSTALHISTGKVYILGPSKTWQLYKGVSILGD